jgi:hypothetical protein
MKLLLFYCNFHLPLKYTSTVDIKIEFTVTRSLRHKPSSRFLYDVQVLQFSLR